MLLQPPKLILWAVDMLRHTTVQSARRQPIESPQHPDSCGAIKNPNASDGTATNRISKNRPFVWVLPSPTPEAHGSQQQASSASVWEIRAKSFSEESTRLILSSQVISRRTMGNCFFPILSLLVLSSRKVCYDVNILMFFLDNLFSFPLISYNFGGDCAFFTKNYHCKFIGS